MKYRPPKFRIILGNLRPPLQIFLKIKLVASVLIQLFIRTWVSEL